MAKYVMTDAFASVAGTNLSAFVDSVEITRSFDDVDITTMGATAHQHTLGLSDDQITINFLQDFAAAAVDATLWPLLGSTGFTVIIRPTSAATSTTNPSFTATCILMEYSPIAGAVGERSETSVTFQCTGAVVRGTT